MHLSSVRTIEDDDDDGQVSGQYSLENVHWFVHLAAVIKGCNP